MKKMSIAPIKLKDLNKKLRGTEFIVFAFEPYSHTTTYPTGDKDSGHWDGEEMVDHDVEEGYYINIYGNNISDCSNEILKKAFPSEDPMDEVDDVVTKMEKISKYCIADTSQAKQIIEELTRLKQHMVAEVDKNNAEVEQKNKNTNVTLQRILLKPEAK